MPAAHGYPSYFGFVLTVLLLFLAVHTNEVRQGLPDWNGRLNVTFAREPYPAWLNARLTLRKGRRERRSGFLLNKFSIFPLLLLCRRPILLAPIPTNELFFAGMTMKGGSGG